MKILVLGASGFIGGHIFNHYLNKKNCDVTGTYFNNKPTASSGVNLRKVNLLEKSEIKGLFDGYDVVIQAAASTTGINDAVNNPAIHVTDNAVMNSLILREASEAKVKKFIFFSCSVMYQKAEYPFRDRPVNEADDNLADEIHPTYFGVGWTKVYLEKMCEFYSRTTSMITHCLRHSNVYGPNDKFDPLRSHVIGATIRKMFESETEGINVWGDGSEYRDYIYISDLVDAVDGLVSLKDDHDFNLWNVGSASKITIRELVEVVRDLAGRINREILFDSSKPTAKTGLLLDSSKLFNKTGWEPKVSLTLGLNMTIEWYRGKYNC
jgi:nucleoside-diphosphate-sugar epimerase